MTDSWMEREKLMRLAGMVESHTADEQEQEEELDWRYDHERQVVKHVKDVFRQLNIPLADEQMNVIFSGAPSNEVIAILDDVVEGISIKQLLGLYRTGMSDDFRIGVYDDLHTQVVFTWRAT